MSELSRITQTALKGASKATSKDGALSNPKTLAAAGVGLAALPVAVEQIAKRVAPKVSDLGEQAKGKISEAASDTASSVGDQAKQAVKGAAISKLTPGGDNGQEGLLSKLTPGSSGEEGDDDQGRAAPGQGGSGRRMPIQQSVDVAVPIKTAYNQWTQFEEWPRFMHRVEIADQVDDAKVAFSTKVWGITKRFEASIAEQRPDKRIEWNATEGLSHTGVVTFHQLSDRLTRIEVTVDVEPDSLLEKAGRGMRHAKRAIRGDLHRFKAYVELNEDDVDDGWRGTIEDGDVKQRTERKPRRSSPSSASGKRSTSGSRSRSRSGSGSRNGSSSRSQSRGGSSKSGSGQRKRARS